jgi:hypothetical protein
MSTLTATGMATVQDVTKTYGSGRTAAQALRGITFSVIEVLDGKIAGP